MYAGPTSDLLNQLPHSLRFLFRSRRHKENILGVIKNILGVIQNILGVIQNIPGAAITSSLAEKIGAFLWNTDFFC
jgi:hypothetical protein